MTTARLVCQNLLRPTTSLPRSTDLCANSATRLTCDLIGCGVYRYRAGFDDVRTIFYRNRPDIHGTCLGEPSTCLVFVGSALPAFHNRRGVFAQGIRIQEVSYHRAAVFLAPWLQTPTRAAAVKAPAPPAAMRKAPGVTVRMRRSSQILATSGGSSGEVLLRVGRGGGKRRPCGMLSRSRRPEIASTGRPVGAAIRPVPGRQQRGQYDAISRRPVASAQRKAGSTRRPVSGCHDIGQYWAASRQRQSRSRRSVVDGQ